jgi:uncharacterized repeat protein (TIGR01451 family)
VRNGNRFERARRHALIAGSVFAAAAVGLVGTALADQPALPTSCKNPTISGRVYVDTNANGLFDTGEAPIGSSALELRNAAGSVVGTTVSAPDGTYAFVTDETKPNQTGPNAASTNFGGGFAFRFGRGNPVTGTIPQFDVNPGCLTKVDIIRSGSITNQVSTENLTSAARTLTAKVTGRVLSISGPGLASGALPAAPEWSGSAELAASDGTTGSGSDFKNFGDQTAVIAEAVASTTSATDLVAYTGSGQVTFSAEVDSASQITGGPDHTDIVRTGANALVRVVYTYIPPLSPGLYTVVQKVQPNGYLDARDTAGNVTPIPGSDKTDVIPVTLAAGGTSPSNNFGETQFLDLKITKDDGLTQVVAGRTTTYKIVATNLGPTDAKGARVTDTLPAQIVAGATKWTCVASTGAKCPASGVGNIDVLVDIPVNGNVTFSLVAKIADGVSGPFTNPASVTPPIGAVDPTPENNNATDTDTVLTATIAGGPDGTAKLRIVKTAPQRAVAGQVIRYKIRVRNTGVGVARSVTLRDPLPPGLTLVSRQQLSVNRSAKARQKEGVVSLPLGDIEGGSFRDVVIDARIARNRTGSIRNVACADGINASRVCDPADTLIRATPKPITPAVTG